MTTALILVAWFGVLAVFFVAIRRTMRRGRVRDRLAEEHRAAFEPDLEQIPDEHMPWLRRWLFLAGYRRPDAATWFTFWAAGSLGAGLLTAWTISASSLTDTAVMWLDELPGGVGALMMPVLKVGPWIIAIILASLPWVWVRSGRRRRVREVEEDLPLTLQILATLARAGLGFDASLTRVLDSAQGDRALHEEMHDFRVELLSGIPRTHAWRRLTRRVEVIALSIFVSAMVHAEQIGGGLAGVLEHQADDVQSRRRERSLVAAQSLPVKLVFPMVICFLPGIFVWTMGPAFYQFLQVIDGVLRSSGTPI